MVFKDRFEAGRKLADVLYPAYQYQHVKVVALPNGGVPVGYEVAKRFDVPLEVIVSRKLSPPNNPEFAIGAVSEEGTVVINEPTANLFKMTEQELWNIVRDKKKEVENKVNLFRLGLPLQDIERSIVIVVDDGLATGTTAQAAFEVVEHHDPPVIIFASPICELDTSMRIEQKVDDIICLSNSDELQAVSIWYEDFAEVSDEKVMFLLHKSYDYVQNKFFS
jgi:putative phosphoribosyl transferase